MGQGRLRFIIEPSDLLALVAADLEFLQSTFKSLDLAWEAHKCCLYWNEKGGAKNWKLAFANWLQIAAERETRYGAGRATQTAAPVRDRMEYLRDYQRRRGLTA